MPVPALGELQPGRGLLRLFADGVLYQAVESGFVYKIDPFHTSKWRGSRAPVELARSRQLWDVADVTAHAGEQGGSNLCIEASPAILGDRLYVSAGSGHVYGLSKKDLQVEWDFRTGSDVDGTTVVNRDGRLLVGIERQYVAHGGVYMLDPSKAAKDAVVWWFPTEDRGIGEWAGGVVGSVREGWRGRSAPALVDCLNPELRYRRCYAVVSRPARGRPSRCRRPASCGGSGRF